VALESLASRSPWALVVVVVVCACTKLIALKIAVRGTKGDERAKVIRAVAELFRWWRR
jgi:hypothetical protein